MAQAENNLVKYSDIFSKRLPGTAVLFIMLLLMSIVMGMASVALLHYRFLPRGLPLILLNGSLAGIIAVLLPTVLTVIFIKMSRHRISVKHTLFISIIGAASYSVFLVLSSILYLAFGISAASITILVGDASIFGWWFFINKVVLGFRKRAVPFAFIQPTLNVILYIAAGRFMFRLDTPLNLLLIKLYSGILIFMIVSYALLYMFDRPMKKSIGVGGVDVFSSMLQNWLFDINTFSPFSTKLGITPDVDTNAVVLKGAGNVIKCIFFIPDIHYGPAGTMGASNFPYILERHAAEKYKAPAFIMHTAVTADSNPISATQAGRVRAALDECMRSPRNAGRGASYSVGMRGSARVAKLSIGRVSIVTFTRAPMVTEDIASDAAVLFRKTLRSRYGDSILIDAHNSRYESAPKNELNGVRFGSECMKDYINAINCMSRVRSSSGAVAGACAVELYSALGMPKDLGRGNLNVAVFRFGGFRHAMVQFNSNNMLPSLRKEILEHLRRKYGIDAEVYTTDTHYVNSIEHTVENVLGRHTRYRSIEPLLDMAVEGALRDIGPVSVYHKKVVMRKFGLWGPHLGENIVKITESVVAKARILSPMIIISGFIVAAWIISLV